MRGLYFDGVVMDEFADQHPQAWSQVNCRWVTRKAQMNATAEANMGLDAYEPQRRSQKQGQSL